jgi:hypothetical protein
MGYLQDSVWNNIFKYSYPVSFISTLFLLVFSILEKNISEIITNKYVLITVYIFIGLSAIFSCISWYNTDLSNIDNITSYIDFNIAKTKTNIAKSN